MNAWRHSYALEECGEVTRRPSASGGGLLHFKDVVCGKWDDDGGCDDPASMTSVAIVKAGGPIRSFIGHVLPLNAPFSFRVIKV